jgi:hypothetical protein
MVDTPNGYQALLAWTAPASPHGPLVRYEIYLNASNVTPVLVYSGVATSTTLAVSPFTLYTVAVVFVNNVGAASSALFGFVTPEAGKNRNAVCINQVIANTCSSHWAFGAQRHSIVIRISFCELVGPSPAQRRHLRRSTDCERSRAEAGIGSDAHYLDGFGALPGVHDGHHILHCSWLRDELDCHWYNFQRW